MHDFIDIYVKLLIAMISFTAPIMLFLLSIFSPGTVIIKKKFDEQQLQIQTILATQLISQNNPVDQRDFINKSSEDLKKNEEQNKKTLDLLNPKRQIKRIFKYLFISLALIMIDVLIKDKTFGWYNHYLSMGLIFGSFISLGWSIYILYQVSWEIINTKRIIAEDEAAVPIGKEIDNK